MSENIEKIEFASVLSNHIDVPTLVDKKTSKKYISWGDKNTFPSEVWEQYLLCSELQSVVNTVTDYIIGEGVLSSFNYLSDDDETIEEVVKKCVLDYVLFGGFAIEGIRNHNGEIVRINYQNVMNVRVDEDLTTAYLSNSWNSWSPKNLVELPLFDRNEKQPHFIFYYRGNITRNINPVPMWVSAMKSVIILNNTRNFHLNNLENNFSVNCIINLNNGNIKSKELAEIKSKLELGYSGTDNAGKFILINNPDKDHAVTIERLESDKFGDLYKSLQDSSTDDVYAAFRINKMLIGANIQTGFSKEEFADAYELFNKTVIVPLQNNIVRAFSKMMIDIQFKPFEIFKNNETNE